MKSPYNVYQHKYGTFITCQIDAEDQNKKECEYFRHRDQYLPVTLRDQGYCRHYSWSNHECMNQAVRKEVKLVEKLEQL